MITISGVSMQQYRLQLSNNFQSQSGRNNLINEYIEGRRLEYNKRREDLLKQSREQKEIEIQRIKPVQKTKSTDFRNSINQNKEDFYEVYKRKQESYDVDEELRKINRQKAIEERKRKQETDRIMAEIDRELKEKREREKRQRQRQKKSQTQKNTKKSSISKEPKVTIKSRQKTVTKNYDFGENPNEIQRTFLKMVASMATSIRDKLMPSKAKKSKSYNKSNTQKNTYQRPASRRPVGRANYSNYRNENRRVESSRPRPAMMSYDRLRAVTDDRTFRANKGYLTHRAYMTNDFSYNIGNRGKSFRDRIAGGDGTYYIDHPAALRRSQMNRRRQPSYRGRYV